MKKVRSQIEINSRERIRKSSTCQEVSKNDKRKEKK